MNFWIKHIMFIQHHSQCWPKSFFLFSRSYLNTIIIRLFFTLIITFRHKYFPKTWNFSCFNFIHFFLSSTLIIIYFIQIRSYKHLIKFWIFISFYIPFKPFSRIYLIFFSIFLPYFGFFSYRLFLPEFQFYYLILFYHIWLTHELMSFK